MSITAVKRTIASGYVGILLGFGGIPILSMLASQPNPAGSRPRVLEFSVLCFCVFELGLGFLGFLLALSQAPPPHS